MTVPQITISILDMPESPQRGDRQNFAAKADPWMIAIEGLPPNFNGMKDQFNAAIAAFNQDVRVVTGAAATAMAGSNFRGKWPDLTGSAALPYSCLHTGKYWMLLTDIADIALSEPGPVNTDWAEIPFETFQYDQDVDAKGFRQTNTRFQNTAEVMNTLGALSIDTAINIENGNIQSLTIAGDLTLSVINWAPAGNYSELMLEVTNGGAHTITWPLVNWIKPDGTFTTIFSEQPVSSLQVGGTDFVFLWTTDGGGTVYGKIVR